MKSSLPYKIWQKQADREFVIAAFILAEDAYKYYNSQTTSDLNIEYIMKHNSKKIYHKGPNLA